MANTTIRALALTGATAALLAIGSLFATPVSDSLSSRQLWNEAENVGSEQPRADVNYIVQYRLREGAG